MAFTASILLFGLASLPAQVSWDRVSELFSHVEAVRDEAHRVLVEARDHRLQSRARSLPRMGEATGVVISNFQPDA